jgi:hypothetical protein
VGSLCRSNELLFADLCVNLKASFASLILSRFSPCLLEFEGFYVSDCLSRLLIWAFAREEQEQIAELSCRICSFWPSQRKNRLQ